MSSPNVPPGTPKAVAILSGAIEHLRHVFRPAQVRGAAHGADRRHRRTVAAALALVLVIAACGNSENEGGGTSTTEAGEKPSKISGEEERDTFEEISGVPGVTDDEIAFSVIGSKSNNPLGNCILDCYVEGIEAYFAYRNSEGGIFGRDLVVGEVLDDEVTQNKVKALDVISANDTFGNFNATLLATGWADLDEAGIPTYTWGINFPEAAGRSHIFPSLAERCSGCTNKAGPWLAKYAGASKAASIGYGVTENSKECVQTNTSSFETYEADSGVDFVYSNDNLEFGLPNGIGPEVSAMKRAGVDFIATCIDLNGMKELATELDRQGMEDVVLSHPNTYNPEFVKEAGDIFEGDYVLVQFRPLEADPEGTALAEFIEWMEKQESELSEVAMVGWINASVAFDGLLAAGPEFDRDKVTAATNTLEDYTAGGLLEPVDWTVAHEHYTEDDRDEEDPERQDCTAVVKVVDGEFELIAEPDKPWMCWEPGKKEWAEPEATTFG